MEGKDMREENLHVTDEQLLLHGGGELPADSDAEVRAHLELCAQCRARLQELESTLAEVAEAHFEAHTAELRPAADSRARLKATLAELTAQHGENRAGGNGSWRSVWSALVEHRQAAVLAGLAIAACLLLTIRLQRPADRPYVMSSSLGHWEEPDLRLTPGATIPVTQNQVCGAAAQAIPAVPVSLKRRVFEEYGVTPPQPDAYEVDYLITPELGGATDIRNLWPEPYQDTVWNAHVKDQLEDRLHEMVCRGDVDLATAQHDISADWIAAYRKYFHVDRPVADDSSFDFSTFKRSLPLT
jgi:hypothetical protein